MTVKEFIEDSHDTIGALGAVKQLSYEQILREYYKVAVSVAEELDLPSLRTTTKLSLIAGEQNYLLPVNMLQLIKVIDCSTLLAPRTLTMEPGEDARFRRAGDEPCYTVEGVAVSGSDIGRQSLVYFPAPTEDATDALLVIYKRRPLRLTEYASQSDEIREFPDSIVHAMSAELAFRWLIRPGVGTPGKDYSGLHTHFMVELERAKRVHNEQFQRPMHIDREAGWW
jgi:hypothetical protein